MSIPEKWQREIDAGTPFGKRAAAAIEKAGNRITLKPEREPDVSDIGSRMLAAFTVATGQEVSCGSCRSYMLSLNRSESHVEDDVVRNVYINLPIPHTIRELHPDKDSLREWVRGIVHAVLPVPPRRDDMIDRYSTPFAIAEYLDSPEANPPRGWHDWPNIIEYHRGLVREAVLLAKDDGSPPSSQRRGIIIPAGGLCKIYSADSPQPYFWCAYAAAHMLRHYGCSLPIEFWFLPGEMEQVEHIELYARRLSVTLHVLDTSNMRVAHGWQVKINAILQSKLDLVIHLDADNIVTRDPEYLFDTEEFKNNAAMFWGDNPALRDHRGYVGPKQWHRLGEGREDTVRDIEAGQMVIDKKRGARALQVVKHLADHAEYWGGFNGGKPGIWYGDKTDFHVGFAITGTPHWICQGFRWNYGGFYEHRDPAGRLLFQHACHKKGHLVNGHRIENLIGNDQIWECVYFRSPVTFPDGSLTDCNVLIAPEKQFEIKNDSKGMSRTVWLDVVSRNEYLLPPEFTETNSIVDIGGNSGAFAYACLRRGAGKVISIEPHPETAERLVRNTAEFGDRIEVINAAAWRSDVENSSVSLHPHGGEDWSCGYSVILSQDSETSWDVPTVGLDDILRRLGAVHILKLDCEGSEYPILYTSKELHRCEHILGEYHLDHDITLGGDPPDGGWPEWTIPGLTDFLASKGFTLYKLHPACSTCGGFWAKRS